MNLSRSGRELLRPGKVEGLPVGAVVELSLDDEGTWHEALDVVDGVPRWLLAGPNAEENPAGTVVVPLGTHDEIIRVRDHPEVVVRRTGGVVRVA